MNKIIRLVNAIALIFFIFPNINAQDASFSQNYASPLYLSPSFTGLCDGSRLSLAYRNQWKTYKTIQASFDHYFSDFNSGLGFLYYRDDQGSGLLVDQNLGLLYAYEVYVSRNVMIRPGIQFKYAQTSIDASKAYLGSQLSPEDGSVVSGGGLGTSTDQTNKFDAAASVMVYSSTYWGGISVDHLVKNDIKFTDIETYRGLKITAFGGFKWIYRPQNKRTQEQSVTFTFNYRQQSDFTQLDFGAYWQYNPLEIGLWYRGLPVSNAAKLSNKDAIIGLLGIHFNRVRVGYSYDLSISNLAGSSGGVHEISLIYTIPSSDKPRINRSAIPCSQQSYSSTGTSRGKYRSRSRSIF